MDQDIRQAVFLVGGKGTRLGELTRDTPKPLLPILSGKCFLDLLVEEAARQGFIQILLLAGHFGDQIKERYDGATVHESSVTVLCEPEPLGTAGALKWAADALDPWFVLANGDSFFNINLRLFAAVPDDRFDVRVALRTVDDISRYGAVTSEMGVVQAFQEKDPKRKGRGDINAGVYVVNKRIIDLLDDGPASIERDIFPVLVAAGRLEARKFDGYFIDMGLPDTYEQAKREIPLQWVRPCAFLDRDGVLNVDAGYTHRRDDLCWIDGAQEAIFELNNAGYLVIVVTNQAGVAHGHYKEEDVAAFHDEMARQLRLIGAHIDAFYACPFHQDAKIAHYRHPNHPDRKPNAGMLERALREWQIDTRRSFLIGDKQSDLTASSAVGVEGHLFGGGNLLAFVRSIRTPRLNR